MNKKGFTLIELLVVIGIIAILATITVIVLNPAQLFAQARDSQRIADMDTIRDGIIFVQSTTSTAPLTAAGAFETATSTVQCNAGVNTIFSTACTTNPARTVSGAGWVGVHFDYVTPTPLAQLPVDPTNNATYFYAYKGDTTTGLFKLGTVLESSKYAGAMTTDGGTATGMYEVGSTMTQL